MDDKKRKLEKKTINRSSHPDASMAYYFKK